MANKLKTSCPFPVIKYDIDIKYTEVEKPSGVSYILLVLIRDSINKKEKLSDVLRQFSIPLDLVNLFADEVQRLLQLGIIEMVSLNYTPLYFNEYEISSFRFTEKGNKVFSEGAIPTGNEGVKRCEVYYNPVTNTYCKQKEGRICSIESNALGGVFMDRVAIDVSGMEDYVVAKQTQFGIKKEEKILDVTIKDREDCALLLDDNMEVLFSDSGMDISFPNKQQESFAQKYYDLNIFEKVLSVKKKFRFDESVEKYLFKCEQSTELIKSSTLLVPEDIKKIKTKKSKLAICLDNFINNINSDLILNNEGVNFETYGLSSNNVIATLIDDNGATIYLPCNIAFSSNKFTGVCSVNLLVEKNIDRNNCVSLLKNLFDKTLSDGYSQEATNVIKILSKLSKNEEIAIKYTEKSLLSLANADDKATRLLEIANLLGLVSGYDKYVKELGSTLFNQLIGEMTIDNFVFKNGIIKKLGDKLGMKSIDLLNLYKSKFQNESREVLYFALTSAGYSTNEALSIANVVEQYASNVINENLIINNNELANEFDIYKNSLINIKQLVGINNTVDYAINDSIDMDKFFSYFDIFITKHSALLKYEIFAQTQFNELKKYVAIIAPIFDVLQIEKNATKEPDKITKNYIEKKINKGDLKGAVIELVIKLQFSIAKKLGAKETEDVYLLIDKMKAKKFINEQQKDTLHNLRQCRNGFVHPDRKQISYSKQLVEQWAETVFEVLK